MRTHILLRAVDASALPREFMLFAFGETPTAKGVVRMDKQDAANVMNDFRSHGMDKLPIDFDHLSLSPLAGPQGKKAAGWFIPEVREQGLFATDVKFTPLATQMLSDREFRFFSPAITIDPKTRRITSLINVALTNLPATKEALPLVASQTHEAPAEGEGIDPMSERLFKLLGAKDEAEALVFASEINTFSAALLEATGTKGLDAALAAVKANAGLPAEVTRLSQEIATMKAANAEAERDALIAEMTREGTLTPALGKEWAHTQTVEQLNVFRSGMPKLGAADKPAGQPAQQPQSTLTDQDHRIRLAMGLSEEDMIEERKLEASRQFGARRIELTRDPSNITVTGGPRHYGQE